MIKFINNRYMITNFYNTNFKKNALLAYITKPFKKEYISHTNFFEARSWAKVLHELGYNVDIVNYETTKKVNLLKYNLICGFGDIFQDYYELSIKNNIKTIYYGTGMHVCYNNHATLKRVQDVYNKKGVWISKSSRFIEKTWTHQMVLVDGMIVLGNNTCANTYKPYYNRKIYSVPAPFYKTQNAADIIKSRDKNANKSFLWFGSAGLIHKGLDILLEYFSKNQNLTLHICGNIESEMDFMCTYKQELYDFSNIILHGFVDINNNEFTDILKKCSFIVFPSCSEGGCPSVLTCIGNGGLIPIVTKETAIDTGYEIWIDSLDYAGIDHAIKYALSLKQNDILNMQIKNYNYVLKNNSLENYYAKLKDSISEIIGTTNEV